MGGRPLRERNQGLSLIDVADSNPKPADANSPFEFTVGIRVGRQVDKQDVLFNARHISGLAVLTAIRFGFLLLVMALVLEAAAGSIGEEGTARDLIGKTKLNSIEITRLLSDVIDRGEVQI